MVNWVLLMQITFMPIFSADTWFVSHRFRGRTFTRNVKYRHQQDVLPWCIQETHEVSFLMSCNLLKSHNTWTKQLANYIVLDVCPQCFVSPFCVLYSIGFVFLWQITTCYSTVWSFVCILTWKRKKPDNNLIKSYK